MKIKFFDSNIEHKETSLLPNTFLTLENENVLFRVRLKEDCLQILGTCTKDLIIHCPDFNSAIIKQTKWQK